MRGSLLLSFVLVGGCASRIRTEHVGTGHGVVSTRSAGGEPSAAPGAGGMPLPRGTYDIDLRIGVPRAQLVDWKVSCAGAEQAGTVGRSFDDYKEERLAQLTKDREQQARIFGRQVLDPPPPPHTRTTVIIAPPVARLRTPIGRVVVQPAPVVVRETQPEPPPDAPPPEVEVAPVTELPPGDLGQGVMPARVRVVTATDGVCAITAVADDPNVSAFYSVTRVRDLGVEEAERKQLIYVGAVDTRGRMSKQLVAYGADPAAKQRRIEAEGKARAEAEARRGAELASQRERELQVNLERRQRAEADAETRRQREAADAERRRIEEDQRRIRIEAERQRVAKLKWEAEAPARARAELLIRQTEVSIKWRLTIIAWLVSECGADADRRGRIARETAQRQREAQARLEIRLEIERVERERLIRIRMEEDRRERERVAMESSARDEARRIEKERLRAEAHERQERERLAYVEKQRQRQAKLDAEVAERENRDAIERARRDREATALAELELRRTNDAIRVRSTMVGSLISFGAKLRTPRPAPIQEHPGAIPFDGAEWASGRWEWISIRGEWQWRGGGWRDVTRFGRTGGEAVVHTDTVVVTPSVIVAPPVTTTVIHTPPVIVTPGVVIEVGGRGNARPPRDYRPRPSPTYQPRPRPAYQPQPQRPTYQPKGDPKRPTKASVRDRRDDDRR